MKFKIIKLDKNKSLIGSIVEFEKPIEGRKLGIINYQTKGLKNLITNFRLNKWVEFEINYEIRPDAILIKEIK